MPETLPTAPVATEPTPDANPHAEAVAQVEAAAAKFYDEQRGETQPTGRPRGPDGKFISTQPTPVEASEPTPTPEAAAQVAAETKPSKIDGALAWAAEQEGFTPAEIAAFADNSETHAKIEARQIERQVRAIRDLGIDPQHYQQYQQWRQNQEKQALAPAAPQPPVEAPSEFKLPIEESDIDPSLVKPFRALEERVNAANKLIAAVMAENASLRKGQEATDQRVRQSAEAAERARTEARAAAEWDKAAKAVPGFTEVMGVPSEALRLSHIDPTNPQVVLWNMFNQQFAATYDQYERAAQGRTIPLPKVVNDAFATLKGSLARFNGHGGNGTNGAQSYGPGSVVRSAPRVGSPDTYSDDIDGEIKRINDNAAALFERANGRSPFAV